MSITDAVNVFLYQSRNVGGLPFDLRPVTPNAETLAAMQEIEDMRNGKTQKNPMSVDGFMNKMVE